MHTTLKFMAAAALLCAALLGGCGTPQNRVDALTSPAGDKGTIIMSVTRRDVTGALMFAPYDQERQVTRAGMMGGYVSLHMALVTDRGFVWKRVRPGTYVLHSLLHQGIWDLCFAQDTSAFTVAAGQTLYLGVFDPLPYERALVQAATDAGDTKLNSKLVRSYMGVSPPARMLPNPAYPATGRIGSLAVSSAISIPDVDVAVLTPARFAPGTDYLGAGGMFHIGGQTCFGANPGVDVQTAQ